MKCQHPNHEDGISCENYAVSCHKDCGCCNGYCACGNPLPAGRLICKKCQEDQDYLDERIEPYPWDYDGN